MQKMLTSAYSYIILSLYNTLTIQIKSKSTAVGELVHALVTGTWKNTFTLPCSHVSSNTCTDTVMHTQTHTPIQSGLLQTHIPY